MDADEAETIPENRAVVLKGIEHPAKPSVKGDLIRHTVTGLYRFLLNGTLTPISQTWAREQDKTGATRFRSALGSFQSALASRLAGR